MIPGLAIDPAAPHERPLLENLSQLYLHDFSPLFAATPRLDLTPDGRFILDPPLDRWWREPDHTPHILRWHGAPAGFALINRHSAMATPTDHAVAEFFVVRKYRRLGLGAAAAHSLFTRHPGRWEAAVMRANTRAAAFWHHAVHTLPAAHAITIHDRADADWNGTIFRFQT